MTVTPLTLIDDCDKCELRAGCSQVVWGAGKLPAELVLVGEAPGAEEDLMGRPWVSREGRLLARLLRDAGIDPDACLFTYAVKCHPGRGKTPTDAHADACRGWLWQELKKSRAKVVVPLGKLPTRMLLGLKKSFVLKDVAGVFHAVDYMGAVISPWFSPQHILQNGKKADREAAKFFKRVLEKVNGNCEGG